MAKFTIWTEEMDLTLLDEYEIKSATALAMELGVSKQALIRRARKIGVPKKAYSLKAVKRNYLQSEDDFIRANVFELGVKAVAEKLNRSEEGIRGRAKRLGVSVGDIKWTDEEKALLLKYYRTLTYGVIGLLVGKSEDAVGFYARSIGLKKR